MPKLTIDGKEIEVPAGMALIQACEQAGIEIPRFCYHERLAIAGNCRMCLVEVTPGPPKPQASCALPVSEGMVVKTNSPMVKKAREGVMEMLLINHPLDCPICDQGGECDLQDQAFAYGGGASRYTEHKRAVEEKYMGPLIKTQMTRCIHCTRCVRFAEDIAGVPELGAVGRGEHMEITTGEKAFASELSGNVVDLCPVGALTSRPYAFNARPWELKKTESIDVLDAVGSNIRIDSRSDSVLRVLPRLHEDVNEEWISDKTRHAIDGLRYQRLDTPYVRKDGKLQPASWEEALNAVAEKFKQTDGAHVAAIAGDLVNAEALYAMKKLMLSLGSPHLDARQDASALDPICHADFLFNTTIAGIEQADALLLIGTNPRHEAPIVNARIRKAHIHGGLDAIFGVGDTVPLTYPVNWLGNDVNLLKDILAGKGEAAAALKGAKRPMLILGSGALTRPDGALVHAMAKQIAEKYKLVQDEWNGFNVLTRAASRNAAFELEFLPHDKGLDTAGIITASINGELDMLFLLGADELDMSQISGDTFVVYQGHHGDAGAHKADVILPAAAYTEQDGTYMNLEGRVQRAYKAVTPRGEAKEDWKIIRALSDYLGRKLPFDTLDELRAQMAEAHPAFATLDVAPKAEWKPAPQFDEGALLPQSFTYPIRDFYRTDAISRVSKTMAECSAAIHTGCGGGCSKESEAA